MSGRAVNRLAAIFMALAVMMAFAAPVMAGHNDGHSKGGKDKGKSSKSEWTEDNDTNDGDTPNNRADDGDNKHPSGKDRSVEGKSGNQGNSTSDPDDDGRGPDRSNGGPDKPNGSGGVDKADQDGNNGCGNDDDFEDDNEGWCGGKPKDNNKVEGSETKGNSSSNVIVTVDCASVTVSSSKDISHIEVAFADGSIVKFDGLSGGAWTQTFTQPVNWAKAKSGTTVVYGSNSSTECVSGSDIPVCPEGSEMNSDGTCVLASGDIVCPEGHEMVGDSCVKDSHTEANDGKITICHATGSATNPYVMITIDLNGMNGHDDHENDIAPAPAGGCPESLVESEVIVDSDGETPCTLNALMPDGKLCENPDEVLADVIVGDIDGDGDVDGDDVEVKEDGAVAGDDTSVLGANLNAAGEEEASGPVARAAEVLGAVLPFTGAGLVKFLVLAALLIGAGVLLARRRRTV